MKANVLTHLLLLGAMACEKVTPERIETWKGTQKGPEKIEQALREKDLAPNLRALAAAALVDMGKPEKMDAILAGIPAQERWEILKPLIDIYTQAASSENVPKVRDARDTLFSLRPYLSQEEQRRLDVTLLSVLEKELREGRFAGGRHSLEKMFTAFGTASSPMIVKLLSDPHVPYQGLAELAAKVCDAKGLEAAGKALLERGTTSGSMTPDFWLSLGLLGGNTVGDYLIQKVRTGSVEESFSAARALQQSRFPTALPMALELAGSAKARKDLRDEMFGVVEKIGGPLAEQGLLQIIAKDKEPLVRYRAHEALIAVGQERMILAALEAFPPSVGYERQDVLDFLVKDITKLGSKAKPAVLSALRSPSHLARMTALLALATPLPQGPKTMLGDASDVPAVRKLLGDRNAVKGFPTENTIGTEAQRVAGLLQGSGG